MMIKQFKEFVLDEGLVSKLRSVVYETRLFRYDGNVKNEYSMICAVADRIQDADRWINDHLSFPDDCISAQTFLMLASVVKSGVEALLRRLKVNRPNVESCNYFGRTCREYLLLNEDGSSLSDDEFFQYFRSLTFSHPQGTFKKGKNNYPFLKEGEIEYSPYVVLEKNPWHESNKGMPSIGIHIYSNMREETRFIFVPYEALLGYLKSRHDSIEIVVAALENRVKEAEAEFRLEKLDRSVAGIEAFLEFGKVIERRGVESYALKDAISYLTCEISCAENKDAVEGFRNEILKLIPDLRGELERLNYENFERRLNYVVDCAWHVIHRPIAYHIGKIFEYFGDADYSQREWGRTDLKILSEDFVGKWVKVSFDMPNVEIRLLVTVAFYMEYGRYLKLELVAEEAND